MKEILLEALRRMDSARSSIQRETGLGYGILDTSDLKEQMEKYQKRLDTTAADIDVHLKEIGMNMDEIEKEWREIVYQQELHSKREPKTSKGLSPEKLNKIAEALTNHLDNITTEQFMEEWNEIAVIDVESPSVKEYMQARSTLSNSEITAACIRAGITELHNIKYIQNNSRTPSELKEDIEYILNQKAKNEKSTTQQ